MNFCYTESAHISMGKKVKHIRYILQTWHIISIVVCLVVAAFFISSFATKKQELGFTKQLFHPGEFYGTLPNVFDTTISHSNNQVEVAVKREGVSLAFQLPLQQTSVKEDKNLIAFSSANGAITTEYSLRRDGLKENIILNQIPKENVFPSTLKTEGLITKISSEGIPVFFDKNNTYQFHFERPFVKDGKGAVSYDVRYKVVGQQEKKSGKVPGEFSAELLSKLQAINQTGQSYVLEVEVDPKWLHDPKRVLPIIIDPTVVHDTSSEFATGSTNRVEDIGSGSIPSLENYYQPLTSDQYTVGLWHMDETSGNALDSSGNGNTGTPTGTSITTGSLGNARSFNGLSDSITMSASTNVNVTGDITVETWINPTNFAVNSSPIHKDGQYSFQIDTNGYVYWADSSNWSYASFGATNIGLTTGQWQHLAFTKSNGVVNIYLDGTLKATKTFGGSITSTANILHFGCYYSGASCTAYFAGKLDEVRISNIARTPEQIKANASRRSSATYTSPVVDFVNPIKAWNNFTWTESGVNTGDGETLKDTTDLVAQWNFNDASGTTATNNAGSCGASCNGTLTNFAYTGSRDASRSTGWTANHRRWGAGALMFDGVNDYVTTGQDIDFANQMSGEIWVKFNNVSAQQVIVRSANTNVEYQLQMQGSTNNSTFRIRMDNAALTAITVDSRTPTVPGKWYYVAWTYDNVSVKLYVDGVLVNSAPLSGNIFDGNSAPTLGYTSLFLNGTLDTTRIYSRALTAAEILSNYQAGNIEFQTRVGNTTDPNDGTWEEWRPAATNETQIESWDTSLTDSLISYWKLDETSGTRVDSWGTNDLTDNNTVTYVTGVVNNAADFTLANSEYLSIADNPALSASDIDYTISAWVNLKTTSGSQHIVSKSGTFAEREYILFYDGSRFAYYIYDVGGSVACSATANNLGAPSINTWYHLVAWHDATANTCNIEGNNGTPDTAAELGVPSDKTGGFKIGAWLTTPSSFLDGRVDEVGFWKRKLTATERTELYNSGTPVSFPDGTDITNLQKNGGLNKTTDTIIKMEGASSQKITTGISQVDGSTAALWHLDETSGTGAYLKDSTSNGNHGTPTGVTNTVINGVSGKARYVGGGSDITVTDSTSLKPTRITIEHWIKTSVVSDVGYFYKYHNASPWEGYGMNVFGASYAGKPGCWVGGTAWTVGTMSVNDNKWHHVACVYDGTNVTVYVDGVAGTSLAQTANLSYVIDLHIGNGSAVNLDEAKISSVARSSEEIAESYRMGRDHYISRTITSTDLSGKTTLPFYIAADRPGTYLSTTVGNTPFANYQPDANTVGLWHMDENNQVISDTFTGAAINPSKWVEIDPAANKISQNNGLVLSAGAAAAWDSAIVSQSTYTRAQGQTIYAKFTTGASVASPNHMMIGWATNSTVTPSHANINHALYFNAGAFYVYQDGALVGGPYGNYVANTTYEIKISLTTANTVAYAVKGGTYTSWTTLLYPDASKVNTPLRVQVAQYQMTGTFSEISVIPADTVKDASGNVNNGITSGAMPIQGKIGKGKSFNGANDYAVVTNNTSLNLAGTPYTLSSWVYINTLTDSVQHYIISRYNYSSNTGYGMYVVGSNGAVGCDFNGSAGRFEPTTTSITAGQWYYLVCHYDGAYLRIFVNGQEREVAARSSLTDYNGNLYFGTPSDSPGNTTYSLSGYIDEPRIDRVARGAGDIRATYEAGLRNHQITIDFGAKLDAGNLITGSGDFGFAVDATYYGLQQKGDALYLGDKIIVKENYNGTEYIAQGTVNSVTPNTGAVTIIAWDAGSTFPVGGYTTNASVFKWQREYWNTTEPLDSQINAVTNLTLKLTDGNEGRTIWIDDLKSAGDYLTTPTGSAIASSLNYRYFQYRTIFSSTDEAVSADLSSVTIDYRTNLAPTTPTLITPTDAATNQTLLPVFTMTTTDPELDYIRYKIEICTDVLMTPVNCQTINQTTSQTGWSGQDVQTYTAYASGSTATYTLQTPLNTNTTYYWRSYAIDPGGGNVWSDTQGTPRSFGTTNSPTAPTSPYTEGVTNPTNVVSATPAFSAINNDPDGDAANKYEIEVNTNSGFTGTVMWSSGATAMSATANGARSPNLTYAGSALIFNGLTYYWRVRFTDINAAVGPWSTTQQFTLNISPGAPTLNTPANTVTGVTLLPIFTTTGTDTNSDYLRYKIEICTNVLMTSNCQTHAQTISQAGWSLQDAQTGTAYLSGSTATYTLQMPLSPNTVYYWRSYAIDPGGGNVWGTTQSTPFSFTTLNTPLASNGCIIRETKNDSSLLLQWSDNSTDENGYEVRRSVDGGTFTTLVTSLAVNTTSYQDTTVETGHTYTYQIAPYYFGSIYGQWCTTAQLSLQRGTFTIKGIKFN
jgi:hypothetical protein